MRTVHLASGMEWHGKNFKIFSMGFIYRGWVLLTFLVIIDEVKESMSFNILSIPLEKFFMYLVTRKLVV